MWFKSAGVQITAIWAATIVVVAFIVVNPMMPGFRQFRVGSPAQQGVGPCPAAYGALDGADEWGGCWPGPLTTGVPDGTVLTPYTGSCAITTPNTIIDSKIIDINSCESLIIQTSGVLIKNSRFDGTRVDLAEGSNSSWNFTIQDSNVNVGNRTATGVGAQYFTMKRVEITGASRSSHCWQYCTVENNYMHAQMTDLEGLNHESGIRQGAHLDLTHNSVICDAPEIPPDAGCSAAITGYGDFATVEFNNIIKNRISSPLGYCAYGGSTTGKPFPNANNNVWTSNRWEKTGVGNLGVPQCGYYGPITSFDDTAPGMVWTDNKYLDGEVIPPSN